MEKPLDYYKSFNKKPVDFRKLYAERSKSSSSSSSEELSTSSEEEESSDDFPSPSTPKRKTKSGQEELFDRIKELESKIERLRHENKKLRNHISSKRN
jgi:TolA-binding protein